MKKIFLTAICFYFFLAPLTYHPDNKLVLYWSGLEQGSVWNIWKYGESHLSKGSQYNYPPVHYYLDKIQYFVAKIIAGPGFDEWLGTQNSSDAYEPKLSRFSLAMKTPLIAAALLVGWLLIKLARQKGMSKQQAIMASGLWFFNPVTLYSIPIMGQNDVLAILFFLIGWYVLSTHTKMAAVLFGVAASVKFYPLLWLVVLLLVEKTISLQKKIWIFLGSCGAFVVTLLPFIMSPVFRSAVFGSSMNERFIASGIDIGFSDVVYVIPLLLLILFYTLIKKLPTADSFLLQLFGVMTTCLILLGFSHFHVQWYTWVIPFWALWMVAEKDTDFYLKKWMISLTVFSAWLMVLFLFSDTALTTGIFLILSPHLATAPIIRDAIMSVGIDALKINNLAHTYLASIAILAIVYLFQEKMGSIATSGWTFIRFKLPAKIQRLSAIVKKIIILSVVIFLVFASTFLIHCIPLPKSSESPVNVAYFITTFPSTNSIDSKFDRLYYVELYFKNSGLLDRNRYLFTLSDSEGAYIISQEFNGYNIGDPGKIRFNIPIQENSKNKQYSATISLMDPMQVGRIDAGIDQRTQKMALQTFYKAPRDPNVILQETVVSLQNILNQTWLLFILLIGIVILII